MKMVNVKKIFFPFDRVEKKELKKKRKKETE